MSDRKTGRTRKPPHDPRSHARRANFGWLALALLALVTAVLLLRPRTPLPAAGPSPSDTPRFELEPQAAAYAKYAGSASCRECHQEAYELWRASNHGLAERPLSDALDRTAFDPPREFAHGSQTSLAFTNQQHFCVASLGLSGTMETHPVVRVIGHHPLRQFLVTAPGGRLQTLEASYDPVTNEWFNVYGNEDRQPGEWGHWTGRGMNWNTMCAGCHNTRVRKNYSELNDSYQTAMVEMTVGCEACHGPMKDHDDWQRAHGRSGQKDPTLTPFPKPLWVDTCGSCHARRSELTGDFVPRDTFFDHYLLTITDETDTYFPDGQIRDENYEYASFLSSKMHAAGVVCMDCHQPHSAKTILPGNWLCLRCHDGSLTNAPIIKPVEHSRHKVWGHNAQGELENFDLTAYDPKRIQETGGECVNCHLPQTPYMQRHWRHDHGFTIPDPLLTKEHGIPNACNRCHLDKTVDWSLEWVGKWYGPKMDRPSRTRARWIAKARTGDETAREPLLRLLNGETNAHWRASFVELLTLWVARPEVAAALERELQHGEPLVRSKAATALAPLANGPGSKAAMALGRLLDDASRAVRVQAAWALRLDETTSGRAGSELRHFLDLNADQPTGQLQKAGFAHARGDRAAAEAHLRRAVAWDPGSAAFRHELAIVLSEQGRSSEAVEQLEAARHVAPREAEYAFKLALAVNETGDTGRARSLLQEAVQLDPRHARAWYNLGLARNSTGDTLGAIEALRRAESAEPSAAAFPYARATIHARLGEYDTARAAALRCLELEPSHVNARHLLQSLPP